MSARSVITTLFLIVFLGLSLLGYNYINGYPGTSPEGSYEISVENGQSLADIAIILEQDSVIHDDDVFNLLARVNGTDGLMAQTYTLNLPANVNDIQSQLDLQTEEFIAQAADPRPSESITFKEGVDMDVIIRQLVTKDIVGEEEMEAFLQDPANFDRVAYPFLPADLGCEYGDLSTCAKYYPEGYFYPDTYEFFLESTPAEVADKFLSNFNRKVWQVIDSQVSTGFNKTMTLASVVELETGRTATGINNINSAQVLQERRGVARVFLNRNDIGEKWKSDITAEYGTGKRLCQQTFEIDGCIYLDSPEAQTGYNTYLVQTPIAPVSNPDITSIQAALNPEENDFLFFVSDITGKTYFAKTNAGHEQNIRDVLVINQELNSQ